MKIENSLDWPKVETVINDSIGQLKNWEHRRDADKVVRNLGKLVSQLSKLELENRRSPFKSGARVKEHLEKVNEEINNLEQWITMLLLY